jgi:hypothetical protein
MPISKNHKMDVNNLSLIKFDMDIKTSEIIEIMLFKLSDNEIETINFLTNKVPFRSSMEEDETYWDMIFLDDKAKNYLCEILDKYGVEYNCNDITDLYYQKSKEIDKTLIKEIDDFLDDNLNIDFILDKISSQGMCSLKKYELEYLNRESKKQK